MTTDKIPVPSSPGSGGGESPHRDPLPGWKRAIHKIEPCGCGVYFDYEVAFESDALHGPPPWNDEDIKLFHCDAHRCGELEQKLLNEGFELPGGRPLPELELDATPTEIAKRFKVILQNGMAWHDGEGEIILAEVLLNARHLADALGVDFFKASDRSYEFYSAEVRQYGTARGEGL